MMLPLAGISLFQAMEAALMLVTVPFRPATAAFQMDAIRGGIANERLQSFSSWLVLFLIVNAPSKPVFQSLATWKATVACGNSTTTFLLPVTGVADGLGAGVATGEA